MCKKEGNAFTLTDNFYSLLLLFRQNVYRPEDYMFNCEKRKFFDFKDKNYFL